MNHQRRLSSAVFVVVILLGNLLQAAPRSFEPQALSGAVLEDGTFQVHGSWTFAPDGDERLDSPLGFTAYLPQHTEMPLLPSAAPQRLAAVARQSLCSQLSRPPPQALS